MKNRIIYIVFSFFLLFLANPFDLLAQGCWDKHVRKYAEQEQPELSMPDNTDIPQEEVHPILQQEVHVELFSLERLVGQRFDRKIENYLYTPKGSWMFGLAVSYLTFDSKESQLLSLLKDFDCTAYTVQVNPFFSYFFRDNVSAGVRFSYGRTFGRIDNLDIDLGESLDLDLSINDVFYQQQMYTGTGFVRTYIGLDAAKRFGLFNETSISFGGGTAKLVSGKGDSVSGTYSDIRKLNIGFKPGLSVFIMNNAAVEVSFGVAGFNYRKETQITDQVKESVFRNSGANFKINLFNINIGIIVCI